jgi:hypothetical protein
MSEVLLFGTSFDLEVGAMIAGWVGIVLGILYLFKDEA